MLGARLRARGKGIGLTGAVGLLIALLYTIFWAPIWEAKATIYFPVKPLSVLGASGSVEASSATAALLGGLQATPLRVYRSFLESETAMDSVTKTTGLKRKEVNAMRRFEEQAQSNTLVISAKNTDRDLALEVVRQHVRALRHINAETTLALGGDDVKAIEQRLAQQHEVVARAEASLITTQQALKTAPSQMTTPTGQMTTVPGSWSVQYRKDEVDLASLNRVLDATKKKMQAALKSGVELPSNLPPVAAFRPRLVELQSQLKIKEHSYGPDAPEVKRLQESIQELNATLNQELARYLKALNSGVVDAGTNIDLRDYTEGLSQKVRLEAEMQALKELVALAPQESVELGRAYREVAIQSAILQQLASQLELAKLQSARDPNKWTLLDAPRIDDDPVNKHYGRNLALGLVLGLALGVLFGLRGPNRG